mmetsp:Transcript_68044/g.221518  ORF Transcript_68044/g.221518 Transcript_68044/m.221518 type:complete len:421 (-) Transcript_68044:6184-7446(-)
MPCRTPALLGNGQGIEWATEEPPQRIHDAFHDGGEVREEDGSQCRVLHVPDELPLDQALELISRAEEVLELYLLDFDVHVRHVRGQLQDPARGGVVFDRVHVRGADHDRQSQVPDGQLHQSPYHSSLCGRLRVGRARLLRWLQGHRAVPTLPPAPGGEAALREVPEPDEDSDLEVHPIRHHVDLQVADNVARRDPLRLQVESLLPQPAAVDVQEAAVENHGQLALGEVVHLEVLHRGVQLRVAAVLLHQPHVHTSHPRCQHLDAPVDPSDGENRHAKPELQAALAAVAVALEEGGRVAALPEGEVLHTVDALEVPHVDGLHQLHLLSLLGRDLELLRPELGSLLDRAPSDRQHPPTVLQDRAHQIEIITITHHTARLLLGRGGDVDGTHDVEVEVHAGGLTLQNQLGVHHKAFHRILEMH